MVNGEYQYDLVKRLSFVRYGGTDDELRAANIILEEIEKIGGHGELMPFTVPAFDTVKCSASVNGREIETVPYALGGQFPEGGVDLKIMYAERGCEDDYVGIDDLSGTAVIINALDLDTYKLLAEKHASAFITINGKWYESSETTDLIPRPLRPRYLELGKVPGFAMRAGDVTEIVRSGAETIHLEMRIREYENTSRDVLAVIPGTADCGESIAVTAHYDSVLVGTGSWDNATGAATIMYLYDYFLKNPPRRTLRFIWCGSEEQGLYGSKAYIEQNEALLGEIKFCFNFDMCGTVLGPNNIKVTGGDDLLHMTQQICRELGYSSVVERRVHSSDSAPFADRGIPAVGISRGTKTAEIHTRNDVMYPLCPERMADNAEFAAKYIERVANSIVMPVKTGMPEDMKEALDKYFQRVNH